MTRRTIRSVLGAAAVFENLDNMAEMQIEVSGQ